MAAGEKVERLMLLFMQVIIDFSVDLSNDYDAVEKAINAVPQTLYIHPILSP